MGDFAGQVKGPPTQHRILNEFFAQHARAKTTDIANFLGLSYAETNSHLLSLRSQGKLLRMGDNWHKVTE